MLARTLYEDIKSGDSESSKNALAKLATASEVWLKMFYYLCRDETWNDNICVLSKDQSFAMEFINFDGLRTLLSMVETGIE